MRRLKKPKKKVNPHASTLGKLSAAVRLERIPAARRHEIAKHASAVRWGKHRAAKEGTPP